ncbi:MAG: hypothetical protein ACLQFF_03935 [Steroidobacteraceae bacterium]|jgi:hypothetical protein
MSAISINSASIWANQISALSTQRTLQANAASALAGNSASTTAVSGGGSLFADLVSALSRQAVTFNGFAAADIASAANSASAASSTSSPSAIGSTASRSQIAQDLQAFSQSLLQALASNQSAQPQSGSSGNAASAGGTVNGSASGIVMPRGYRHGHGGMTSRLESLINTLNQNSSASASSGTSSASTSANVSNLNTTFSKLMTDLGVGTSTSPSGSTANPVSVSASNVASTSSAGTSLPSLLQGMLQHLQQQGSWRASVGHVVNVLA